MEDLGKRRTNDFAKQYFACKAKGKNKNNITWLGNQSITDKTCFTNSSLQLCWRGLQGLHFLEFMWSELESSIAFYPLPSPLQNYKWKYYPQTARSCCF